MTTLALLTEATLNKLYGVSRLEHPAEDTITATLATGAVALVPATQAMWKKNDLAEFPTTDEIVRMAEDGDASTVIRRAQLGTTMNVGTYASGSVIVKNPPYPRFVVKQAIREVIRNDLWPRVWTWHRDKLVATSTGFMYELDEYTESVAMVYQGDIDSDDRFRPFPPGWWDVERQIHDDFVANRTLLTVGRVYDYDEDVYVTAKRKPHVDDLDNLSDEIADLIPWAAAAKCLAERSPQIKNAAARTNRDQEGELNRDYRNLMSEFIRMKDQLAKALDIEVREDKRWRGLSRVGNRSW